MFLSLNFYIDTCGIAGTTPPFLMERLMIEGFLLEAELDKPISFSAVALMETGAHSLHRRTPLKQGFVLLPG